MRYSALFGKTFREIPHELKSKSQILLVQGGFVRFLGRGLYSYLPLGIEVLRKIENLMRDEMVALAGQEVRVPLVNPLDLWQRGGREAMISNGMARFADRHGRDLVLSPSHEEAMVELVRSGLKSYRDLPIFLFQFQTKFRDEEKPKSGLIRAREFVMKDAYSFHRTYHELNNFFPRVFAAYQRIFARCGLKAVTAEGSVGFMGGEKAYEFLMPTDEGNNVVIVCRKCGYQANQEIAKSIKPVDDEPILEIQSAETPGCTNMDLLGKQLKLPKSKLAKALVYKSPEKYIMSIVRADFEVSYEKLSALLGVSELRLASGKELINLGLIRGYLSPIGKQDLFIIADESAVQTPNLVYGSNTESSHLLNVNYGRDYEADLTGDIALARAGHRCLQCHGELKEVRAIELGNIFKLTDFYSRAMNLYFQDENGSKVFPQMGSYGIGLGRLLSAVVESNRDERGIAWPVNLAPYIVFLMGIGKALSVKRVVERIYHELEPLTLLDNRHESPGVKFNDCDLIGVPLRVVISARLLEIGKAELYERKSGQTREVNVEDIPGIVLRYREEEVLDGSETKP
ncbi:MAG: proline--tRNA ligase [Spirochaetales bacterium]|jgi:prolyl-tRNA synthetase|nr:proline--tRNA ligase [Spirochaetales bacterium]